MPNLANTVSPWSGANLNIKNLDVVDLEANSISCDYFTLDGEPFTATSITDLETKTQYQEAADDNTEFTGTVTVTDGIVGTLDTESQPNVTSLGTLTSLAVTGDVTSSGTVTGTTGLSGTLTTAAQANVTSVGTLSSLAVTGLTSTGSITVNTNLLSSNADGTRIGILNTTPNEALDVTGSIRTTSSLYCSTMRALSGTIAMVDPVSMESSLDVTGAISSDGTVTGTTGLSGTLLTAAQTNITSVGTLDSLAVTGAITSSGTVTGTTGLSGTLLTAAQTNITSVGTLSSLSVSGTATLGTLSLTNLSVPGTLDVTGNVTVNTSAMKVDATNKRLGIGMASPSSTLDIITTETATSLVVSQILASSQTGGKYTVSRFGVDAGSGNCALSAFYYLSSASTSNDYRMYLAGKASTPFICATYGGKMGVHKTSPSVELDVTGSGAFSGDVAVTGSLTVDTDTLKVDATNNRVGVGTTSPSVPFHVTTSTTGTSLEVQRVLAPSNTTSGNYTESRFGVTNSSGDCAVTRFYYSGANNANNRIITTFHGDTTSAAFCLRNDGSVGFHTINPTYPLDVNGNTRVTGSFEATAYGTFGTGISVADELTASGGIISFTTMPTLTSSHIGYSYAQNSTATWSSSATSLTVGGALYTLPIGVWLISGQWNWYDASSSTALVQTSYGFSTTTNAFTGSGTGISDYVTGRDIPTKSISFGNAYTYPIMNLSQTVSCSSTKALYMVAEARYTGTVPTCAGYLRITRIA